MKNTVLIILALFMGFASCKKDEEVVPEVNKDDLLCQEWKTENYLLNGESYIFFVEQFWTFSTNYKMEMTTVYEDNEEYTVSYTWRWVDEMNSIEILTDDVNKSPFGEDWVKLNIIELNNGELILESEVEGGSYRIELIKN